MSSLLGAGFLGEGVLRVTSVPDNEIEISHSNSLSAFVSLLFFSLFTGFCLPVGCGLTEMSSFVFAVAFAFRLFLLNRPSCPNARQFLDWKRISSFFLRRFFRAVFRLSTVGYHLIGGLFWFVLLWAFD